MDWDDLVKYRKPEPTHPNGVHAIYMDHVNRGQYYVGRLSGPPFTLSEYCEWLIGLWNDANDGDCPLDYCTNRDDAMKWLNARLAKSSEAPQPEAGRT